LGNLKERDGLEHTNIMIMLKRTVKKVVNDVGYGPRETSGLLL
jgi:hypothetical protein